MSCFGRARRALAIGAVGLMALASSAFGQARQDVAGGKDHALLSRYQGSWLIAYRQQPFAQVRPLAMMTESGAARLKLDRSLSVEGEVAELFYVSPKGRTALEVQRNYETALTQAGAKILYTCTGNDYDCHGGGGPANPLLLNREVPLKQQAQTTDGAYYAFGATAKNLRMSVMQLTRGGVTSYITAYTVDCPNDSKDFGGSAATYLQIVQPKAMDAGKVTVFDAKQIANGLQEEGKMSFYGIYFATGKADLQPQSKAQLEQMAKTLTQSPALKVFIVGHTDNQGGVEANVALSQRRAEAVVASLVRDYKIDANRVAAKGVASFAPLASNTAESGRARNRRVEMVVQ
jgi:OmpA-OmpF porin, OOP family